MNANTPKKSLPRFIEDRLDFFLQDRIESNLNKKHLVQGKIPTTDAIVLQSNDYLSLSQNIQIQRAHQRAISANDDNVVMSAIFQQDELVKPEFETELAQFMGMESCLLAQSGWAANIGLLQTICAEGVPVYIDFFAHMSLWEGAKIAGADIHPFMHNNTNHLRKLIARYGKGIILVDSVYSTIGTLAPLETICDIAQTSECALVVDESHSLGTHGPQGAGLVKQLGLSHQVDFITVSLAKTFAYRAGAILGSKKISQTLPFVSFPAIFSSAMLPSEIARLDTTLEEIRLAETKRKRLFSHAQTLRKGLKSIGFKVRSQSQIVALECGNERNTERVRDFLEDNNIFGSVFCRPATTKNSNIIRFSLCADLDQQDIDDILTVCQLAYDNPELEFI
ncbi:alpha-hydroxyketone-type quorum-sensing autoinducer synthase [Vibrio ishigakensis]|uniref:alpha-hydroxyketone-type quorum-sensing autoinducer synthase n=1 Tax=Vibrio ishigakensis TaxID=1481914 RepID=UPI0021C39176|nr:alpha-hydroxyketone-type quorum-sensing autoinducer synthase [Vibrio ishigakensis]